MTAREVLIWPDPRLKQISEPITQIDESTHRLVRDLTHTMVREGPSAGISAPQIGVYKRLFIVDIPPDHNHGNGTEGVEVYINPEIIYKSDEVFTWDEGCLSLPGLRGQVTRHYTVVVRYQNLAGETLEREAIEYLGGCFQHEIDHLNGILWVDYQSKLKQNLIRKKMLKLKKAPI